MRIPRIYQKVELNVASEFELTPEASHYISKVLRLTVDSPIILFNGNNYIYQAKIIEIKNKSVKVHVNQSEYKNIESNLQIHLGQVISRGDKMDLTIQKAVELGVTSIHPLTSARCGVKLDQSRFKKKLLHWTKIAISACEQSGRNFVPKIHEVTSVNEWVNDSFSGVKICLEPRGSQKIKSLTIDENLRLLIGPEGGFNDEEINLFQKSSFSNIILGKRILRTETAGLAAISALQTLFGDF